MSRNSSGIWAAMKAGKFWHEPEPKMDKSFPKEDNPAPDLSGRKEKVRPKKARTKKAKPPVPVRPDPSTQPPLKVVVKKPKVGRTPPPEHKLDVPFTHPDRPSQTGVECNGKKRLNQGGKVLDLDLWEGDTTEIYPKITVMPHGLRLVGTHQEFSRLARKLIKV